MRNRLFFLALSLAVLVFTLMGCGVADDARRLVTQTEGASPTDAQPVAPQGTPTGFELRLLSPASGTRDVDPEGTELSWKVFHKGTTTEATGFRFEVYLSKKNPPDVALKNEKGEIVLTTTKALTGKLSDGTTYYWQVVAKDLVGNLIESEVRSFRTKEAPAPKISLSAPLNNATGVELRNVTLGWTVERPAEFVEFEVSVSTSSDLSKPITQKTKSTNFRIEGPLQKSTKYLWKVVGYLNGGGTVESEVFSFETIAPSTPVFISAEPKDHDSVPSTKDISFNWNFSDADGDQLSYVFELFGTTPTDTATPLVKEATDASKYKLTTRLDYDTRYYWRVSAMDADGNVVRSPFFTFTTPKFPLPENPKPSDKAEGVPISTRELAWDYDIPDETKRPTFVVLFGESEAEMRTLVESSSTLATLPSTLSYQTNYFWKVDVKRDGEIIAQGPVWRFRTEELPKLITTNPTDGGYLSSERKVSWKLEGKIPSDYKMRFVIATGTDMPPLHYEDIEPSSTEVTIPKELLSKGRTYFWTLRLTDTSGKEFTYRWSSFKTPEPASLGTIKVVEPRAGEEVEPGKVSMKWEHVDLPASAKVTYEVLLGSKPEELTVVASGLERRMFEFPNVERGRTYYWRVRATDRDENILESEIFMFKVSNVLVKEEFSDEEFINKYKMLGLFERVSGLSLWGRTGNFLKMTTRHASSSELEFDVEVPESSVLQIDYYVSSEEGYDFFKIFVNDKEVLRDSGEKPWQRFSYPLEPGKHRVKLVYVKDEVRTRGWFDAVFIDSIILKSAK